mmetsp:Transcript_4640/g.14019  ORF Transcript_4640/g.14019 Transcript_4640/m.14019 type:complete len:818 (-) Transcript_4640:121-2574(-)
MSFFTKALQGAEKFLEQVDEGVAKASARLEESARAVKKFAGDDANRRDDVDSEEYYEEGDDGEGGFDEEYGDEENGDEENLTADGGELNGNDAGWDGEWDENQWADLEEKEEGPAQGLESEYVDNSSAEYGVNGPNVIETQMDTDQADREPEIGDVSHGASISVLEQSDDRAEQNLTDKQLGETDRNVRTTEIAAHTADTAWEEQPASDTSAAPTEPVTEAVDVPSEPVAVQISSSAAAAKAKPGTSTAFGVAESRDEKDASDSKTTEPANADFLDAAASPELQELQNRLSTSEVERSKLEGKLKALLVAKKKSDQIRSKLDKEKQVLLARLEETTETGRALETELDQVEDRYNTLKAQNKGLNDELSDLKYELKALIKEKESSSRSLKQSTELVDHLEAECRDLRRKLADFDSGNDAERQQWQAEVENLQHELDQMHARLTATESEAAKAREMSEAEKNFALNSLRNAVNEANIEKDVLEAENARLRDIINREVQAGIESSNSARHEVTSIHQELEREMNAHRETQRIARAREEALEAAALSHAEALAQTERKIEAERNSASKMVAEYKELKNRAFTAENALKQAQEQVDKMQKVTLRVTGLEEKIVASDERLAAEEAKSAQLAAACASRDENIGVLEKKLQEATKRGNEVEIAEMQAQVKSLADATLHKQSQVEFLRGENKALQLQLDLEKKRTKEAEAIAQNFASQSRRGRERDIEGGGHGPRKFTMAKGRPSSLQRLGVALEHFDRFSLGVLSNVRREPILRMLFIAYIFFMHILAYYILHHASYQTHMESRQPARATIINTASAASAAGSTG